MTREGVLSSLGGGRDDRAPLSASEPRSPRTPSAGRGTRCEREEEFFTAYHQAVAARRNLRAAKLLFGLGLAALTINSATAILTKSYPQLPFQQNTYVVEMGLGAPRGLREHFAGAALPLESVVIAIDPARQEERVYAVTLREVMRHPVSTGKHPGRRARRGDGRTPENNPGESYVITSLEESRWWRYAGRPAYGPWFARFDTPERSLSVYGAGKSPFGLHGTDEPGLLGRRASHGCVRHENRVIEEMRRRGYLAPGTRVVIRSGLFGVGG